MRSVSVGLVAYDECARGAWVMHWSVGMREVAGMGWGVLEWEWLGGMWNVGNRGRLMDAVF